MRPLVFLDFDGVLNSLCSFLATGHGASQTPDSMAVGLMNRLVREVDAHVVVSSSWRINATIGHLQDVLRRWGGDDIASAVIGKTPEHGETRGAEIARWLADHPRLHDDRWVIVDDDDDMLDGQLSRFVRTSFRDGFGVVEYAQALRILDPGHADLQGLAPYLDGRRGPARGHTLTWET